MCGQRPPVTHGFRQRLRRLRRPAWLGTLRRLTPLSSEWGFDRGTPVDCHYIERFLEERRADVRGRVLEVRDNSYTRRFGTTVARSDVLDVNRSNPAATIIADLSAADQVPSDAFDCLLLTQTLQFVLDTRAALAHTHRILRPGGVVLATGPAISRIAPRYGLTSDYWRFTAASCRALFGAAFGAEQVEVQSHGNVLAATAFLAGMAREELSSKELDTIDAVLPGHHCGPRGQAIAR